MWTTFSEKASLATETRYAIYLSTTFDVATSSLIQVKHAPSERKHEAYTS